MTRDEWYAYIESVPLTENQLGRIVADFERLGVYDRAERLAITAVLARLDVLGSTRDLTQGQAGRVVWTLERCSSRWELPAVDLSVPDDVGATVGAARQTSGAAVMWSDVMAVLAAALILLRRPGLVFTCGGAPPA